MALRLCLLVTSLLAALATATLAQDYAAAQFEEHGFAVALPDSGELVRPGAEGWDNDEEIAFEWYGPENTPVALIQARVDDLGSDIDPETFRMFADALLGNWTTVPPADGGDDTRSPYKVNNAADNLQISGRTWNLIEVEDRTDPTTPVYYSVFSTYEGTRIYTVTLYYLQPNMEQVQEFGRPVLQGFNVL